MSRLSRCLIPAVCLVAVFGVGCSKDVKLTFVNTTGDPLPLMVTVPGEPTASLGTIGPRGGMIPFKAKIDRDYLPASVTWRAGSQSGSVPITDETPGSLWVDILADGPARVRDKHTIVRETREVEAPRIRVRQGEVVE